MVQTLNFYLDDSGPRYPDQKIGKKAKHEYDWFALGGILVNDEDEPKARAMHADFMKNWDVPAPLHSSEIRSQNENFFWLRGLDEKKTKEFYEELYCLMRDSPVTGIACVIDRPGYDTRYKVKYAEERWMLCKTAFAVAVERAAKRARSEGRKLRVFPERCNAAENSIMKSYYEELRVKGSPFSAETSDKYGPLTAAELTETLYEFALKAKTSPLAQMADLYLWPICMGGYHKSNRTFARLVVDKKLIEAHLAAEALPTMGSKYSCFEGVTAKP